MGEGGSGANSNSKKHGVLYSFVPCKKGYTVKKRLASFPSLAGMSLTKLSLAELVTSPAEDEKIDYLFYSVYSTYGSVVPVHPDPVVRQNLG